MEPLTPELVDELLSAELDGAFDAAAREHGYAPAIARELLDAVPGVHERRNALAATRDATAVNPLSAPDRGALVAGALRAARVDDLADARASRRPRLAKYVAAAAAVLVVVGLGVAVANVSNDGGGDDSSSASGAASVTTNASKRAESDDVTRDASGSGPTSAPPLAVSPGFGIVDGADTLRQRVEAALGGSGAPTAALQENRVNADSAPPTACVTKQAQALGVDPTLVLDGTIVYAGTPGEVLVFRRGNDALVLVVADPGDTCRLLASQLLHQGT
jgi:hypothetical protein